jgi:hypothetical protein
MRLAAVEQDQKQAARKYAAAPTADAEAAILNLISESRDRQAAIAARVAELGSEQRHQQADEQRTIERINVAMADLPQAWADGSLQVRP